MRPRLVRPLALTVVLAAVAALSGCSFLAALTAGGPATTPATSTAATPAASPATPPGTPQTQPSAPRPSQQPTTPPRTWPKLQGEAGGVMMLDGKEIGRDGPESEKALLAAMGTPDDKREQATCGTAKVKNTVYRWGDVQVTVLREIDKSNEYGFSYPAGAIAGWLIDPSLDGQPGLTPAATGPSGTTIGTDLATLKKRFTTKDWDWTGVEQVMGHPTFTIFVGDTTGAAFRLDGQNKVAAMSAGYTC